MKINGICLIMVILGLLAGCAAGAESSPGRDASWFEPVLTAEGSVMHLLSAAELDVIAELPSKEVHALMDAMFLAAAGAEEQAELKLWRSLKTKVQREERSAENAGYRVLTLPWVKASFSPGNRVENATLPSAKSAGTAADAGFEEPVGQENAAGQEEPVWLPENSAAAFAENPYGQSYLTMLQALGGTNAEKCLAVAQAVTQRWLAEIEHERLKDINGHYQLWLYAPGTPIDYPVVQCGNNSYYLERMFNRKSNPSGTLFIDYRNLPDFDDPNTLIYGHHMRDSSMFHCLTDFDAGGFYDTHPWMVAISAEEIYLIELVAGYVTDSRDHCYEIAISDADDMQSFVERAIRKSYFTSHTEVQYGKDHLVTMSTCAYNFDNARCVLIGRLDRVWKHQPADAP